jgi:hypothetical protein
VYFDQLAVTRITSTRSGSKPGLTFCRLNKLRSINPAPTNSTNETAT